MSFRTSITKRGGGQSDPFLSGFTFRGFWQERRIMAGGGSMPFRDKKSPILTSDQAYPTCQLHIPTPRRMFMEQYPGQVFWLVDRPTGHAFPSLVHRDSGISCGFRPKRSQALVSDSFAGLLCSRRDEGPRYLRSLHSQRRVRDGISPSSLRPSIC